MKNYFKAAISLLLVVCFFLVCTFLYKSTHISSFHKAINKQLAQPDFPDEALNYEIIKTRDPVTGEVPSERLTKARNIQLRKFQEQKILGIQSPVSGIGWTERGPDNVGGRTRAILYDINDPSGKKVWAGGVGGGLWYTNDITATPTAWNKISDTLNNLAISCITQGKGFTSKSKLFFGTGEGWANADAIRGNGIWRSLDAGTTWTHLLSTKDNPAFRFVQDILYVENAGGPCGFGTPGLLAATLSGVYKSTDDGDTWTKVLGTGIAGAAIDAAADLESAYYYTYATLGLDNAGGGGIYRSCNAGETWVEIYHSSSDEQRIEIAEHYLDAWELYAVVQESTGGVKKIMKSDNADSVPGSAVIWNIKTLPTFCNLSGATEFTNKQAWYDLIIEVAPIFRNPPTNDHHFTAYVGGVDLHKTTNSGSAWTQISEWANSCSKPYVHADKHNIVFKPDPLNAQYIPDEFLVATDGGIFRTTDGGASYTARNKSYNITQFFSCAFHPTLTDYFLAGSQDNSTQKFTSAGMNSTSNIVANDNDGGFCYIDQDNPSIQIASYVRNNYFVSVDGGANFNYFPKNDNGQFVNPTDYDNASNILYGGESAGSYFRWTNPAANSTPDVVSVTAFNGAKVTFVALSPTVANRVYFGLNNGSVVQVDNANTGTSLAGVVIRPDIAPNYFLSCIAIDPSNEDHMLISYSNYGVTKLFESSTGTAGSLDWNSVQGDLPDMPVRWCMFDPRNSHWAILATEKGIWSTDNLNASGTTNWSPTNNNFANTRVDMLRYRSSDRLLLAATHGRGLFSAIIPASSVPITLLDFDGKMKGDNIELWWSTSSEQNSKRFAIERSYNGISYKEIGSVNAAGNSQFDRTYHYIDKSIPQANNYYRLSLVDLDNKQEYSRVVLVRKPEGSLPFKVLNNPFHQYVEMEFGEIPKGKGEIRLMDINGRTLQQETLEISPRTRYRFQVAGSISNGAYLLQVIHGGKVYKQQILKQ